MKLVVQELMDSAKVAEECEDYQQGHKKFAIADKRYVGKFIPAVEFDGSWFQLTLHRTAVQGSPVVAFACGRIMERHKLDVAVIEHIGVSSALRGKLVGIRMLEYIMKFTGLPLMAAWMQTPQGHDLWLRTLQRAKAIALYAVSADGEYFRVLNPDDLKTCPFDLYDGGNGTFFMEKNYRHDTYTYARPRAINANLNKMRRNAK
jgi:hypothetical protein